MDTSHREHPHPKERTYVRVALVLAVITAIEIAVSYTNFADWQKVVGLLVLSVVKFVAVVGYFMHLKFDNPLLRKPFIAGLAFALSVYTIVLLSLILHNT